MSDRATCAWCGTDVLVPIVYGYPDDELFEAGERGEVEIGGCIVEEDAPTDACHHCGVRVRGRGSDAEVVAVARPWRRAIDAPFEVLGTGVLPVVVHVPHAGLHVPEDVRAGIVLDDDELREELRAITDHRTDALAAGAVELGARAFVNRLSRLVVDPERFPDPDDEVMTQVGMSAVYTRTTDQQVLREPSVAERDDLLTRFFAPYAERLADLVEETLDRHGRCVVVDVHSYPTRRLEYELGTGERPEVCVGVDDTVTPEPLATLVEAGAADHGLGTARNTPFAGTYVPLKHLHDPRVTSVMLEIRRDRYLDEATAHARPSGRWVQSTVGEAAVRAFVTDVVARTAA